MRLQIPDQVIDSDERWDRILTRREPLVENTIAEQLASSTVPGTDMCKSSVQVPIVAGDRRLGGINVENHEREHAFGESEVRLLTTIASSLGVALESARLLRRDPAPAQGDRAAQRRAGGDQQHPAGHGRVAGLPGHRRPGGRQAARGAQAARISASTGSTRRRAPDHPLYVSSTASACTCRPRRSPTTRAGTRWCERAHAGGLQQRRRTLPPACRSCPAPTWRCAIARVPIIGGDRVLGRIGLENHDREHAFGEAELRLLTDRGRGDGRGAAERAALRRDPAPAQGDRAAQRRARGDQQHPAGHGRVAGLPGHRRPRRRQAARGAAHRGPGHPAGSTTPGARCATCTRSNTASAWRCPTTSSATTRSGRRSSTGASR